MCNDCLLYNLALNNIATVSSVVCTGLDRRRFLDLGIIKGTKIKPILKSPSGDLRAYEIRKSVIALRKEDAKKILVSDNSI